MENSKNDSVIETYNTSVLIWQYYGHFDDAYLLLSQLTKGTRSMLHDKIHLISKVMSDQKRTLRLGRYDQKSLNDIASKVPLGLYTIEHHLSNGQGAKDFFAAILQIKSMNKEHIPGWGDFDTYDIQKVIVDDDSLAKIIVAWPLKWIEQKLYKSHFCTCYGCEVENINYDSVWFKNVCHSDSAAEKFKNNLIKSIDQLTVTDEVGDTEICRVVTEFVRNSTVPIKGIRTGIEDESYSFNHLSETVQNSLERLEICSTEGKTDCEAYRGLGCKNLKYLKVSYRENSDTQTLMQKVTDFANEFTNIIDFDCYVTWKFDYTIIFKNWYVASKSNEKENLQIFYANEVKIKMSISSADFEFVDNLLVLKSFSELKIKKLNPNLSKNVTDSFKALNETTSNPISDSECLIISLDFLSNIKLSDDLISKALDEDKTEKLIKLIQSSKNHSVKIKSQELYDSENFFPITDEIPFSALHKIEQPVSLYKNYKVKKFIMSTSSYNSEKVLVPDADRLIETMYSKNFYEHCTDFQINLANENDLAFILKPLLKFRKLTIVKILVDKFEDQSNNKQIWKYVAMFLKKFSRNLSSFWIRGNIFDKCIVYEFK